MTNHPNRSNAIEVSADRDGDCFYLRIPGPGGRDTRNNRVTHGHYWCYDHAPTLDRLIRDNPRFAPAIERWLSDTNELRTANGAPLFARDQPPSYAMKHQR